MDFPTHHQVHSGFSTRAAGRLSAVLFMACGLVTFALTPFTAAAGAHVLGTMVVAVSAMASAVVIWSVPWHRWSTKATLVLVPVALAHIAAFNSFAAEPYLYDLYFMVAMVWLGLVHRPGTSVRISPALLAAYVAPAAVLPEPATLLASAAYVVPVCVVVGEAVAWVANELMAVHERHRRGSARFEAVVQRSGELMIISDAQGIVTYATPTSRSLLGVDPDDVVGTSLGSYVHEDDRITLKAAAAKPTPGPDELPPTVEFRLRCVDGAWRWLDGVVTNLLDDPDVGGVVINARDVTSRRAADEMLAQIAYHDSLTGLPNRSGFLRALEERLSVPGTREPVSVLFLDLDGFKTVNDSLGHAVGDLLLMEVGGRLIDAVGPEDLLARLGGDEFVVLVPSGSPAALLDLADRIAAALSEPFHIIDRELVITASIGVATAEGDDDASGLFLKADLAMYRAKAEGKARCVAYDVYMARDARQRLDREAELRRAVERGEFVLEYQSELELTTGRVASVEALLRWDHPEKGRVSPLDFIPIAEETGLILPIGGWVLRTAVAQAAVWLKRFGDQAPLMSVNVSAHQMLHPDFVHEVRDALADAGLPARMLRLELTESVLADHDIVEPVLMRLRNLGVGLAIDDLGTGYSSLGYLHKFPVDTVKIDRSFLDPIVSDQDRAPVVEAIVAMGHSLDMIVVAEGVERTQQVALLRRLGCDRVQGFLYYKPCPADEVSEVLLAAARAASAEVAANWNAF